LYDHGWSQNDLTVNASALGAPPIAGSALAGYSTEFNDQQHVIYIGIDLHVHELVFDNGWHHTDLTIAAGAAAFLPRPASPLAGFATEFNNQQHVFYIDQNGLIHELMFDTGWHHANLTLVGGAANSPAGVGSMLAGYVTGFNEQQHVVYIGFDNHVHELMHDGGWHHSDLTVAAGATAFLPTAGSGLDGYATPFNQQQHVNYIGTDNHVHELFFDNSWHHNDLIVQSSAPAIRLGTPLVGYATTFDGQQHVIYIGADSHVHELWF
jgi:hypothetical protein